MTPFIACRDCQHLTKNKSCEAFSKGIPKVILEGKNDHSKPLPKQDNDIVFEPREEKK